MPTDFTHGCCSMCGRHEYLRPLHGERGGPMCCLVCIGKWDAEHVPLQRARRVLIRALQAYQATGGKLYGDDFDTMKLSIKSHRLHRAVALDDFKDMTSELLTATLALTHPDRHPLERQAEAQRVTQELTALQPFVFPAPAPEPLPPSREKSERDVIRWDAFDKLFTYPCEDCRDTIPLYYCDSCKVEHEKRWQAENEQDAEKQRQLTKKQRERYARRRALNKKPQKLCACGCGKVVKSKRDDARFHDDSCRQRAHRKKL
jgi:hypothetical protein